VARVVLSSSFFFQAEDGIRDWSVTGVQTCALPICADVASRLFVIGDLSGEAVFAANSKLRQYAEETGRDVGAYTLYTLVLAETRSEERRVGKRGRSPGGEDH